MNFIFRRPFVTKQDKAMAKSLLETAEILMDAADKNISNHNGRIDSGDVDLIQKAAELGNRAAKRLGFRDMSDMHKYFEIHGKI